MRLLSFTSIALLFAASAASAQSRLIVTGVFATVEVSLETGATRPLNRPVGAFGGVAVDGGRYIVSVVVDPPVVQAWSPRTGQLLASLPLPGAIDPSKPALAGDSLNARAFVWIGSTISSVTASGLTPLVNDVQPPSSVNPAFPRLIAFAPVSRTLFVVRANAGVLELASFTDAGVPITSIPLANNVFALAVTSDGTSAFLVVSTPSSPSTIAEGRRYDLRDGAVTNTVPLPAGFTVPDRIALDEAHQRVTFTDPRTGFYAFTFDLTPVNAFPYLPISPSGACRFDVAFDQRIGTVLTTTTAIPYPYAPVSRQPVVTALDVVTGAVLGTVAVNPSPDSTTRSVMCGGGSILLTPPVAPTLEPAVVTGTAVTLRWDTVRDSTNYRVEATIGSGAAILTTMTHNQTSLMVSNVPAGTYTVRVRGVNDSGLGVLSAPISVTVP